MAEGATFQRERITDLWGELQPLAEAHLAETGNSDLPLKMSHEVYEAAQVAGCHRFYTARINGELVGYCSMILSHCVHDGAAEAHEDGIYVVPFHRGFMGTDLERWSDDLMALDDRVQRVYRERIIEVDMMDRAMRRGPVGYHPRSMLWRRDLKPVPREA